MSFHARIESYAIERFLLQDEQMLVQKSLTVAWILETWYFNMIDKLKNCTMHACDSSSLMMKFSCCLNIRTVIFQWAHKIALYAWSLCCPCSLDDRNMVHKGNDRLENLQCRWQQQRAPSWSSLLPPCQFYNSGCWGAYQWTLHCCLELCALCSRAWG